MAGFWGSYFGNMVMTFLVAMAPVLELRGAIPVGVANGLDVKVALIVAILGNLVPVPFIIIFIREIFLWMRTRSERLNGIVVKLENKAAEKSEIVNKYEWWGLVILVAIPLPGTGAWTGALVAAMLNMRLKRAFPAIAIGVVIAGIIVSYLTYGATMLF